MDAYDHNMWGIVLNPAKNGPTDWTGGEDFGTPGYRLAAGAGRDLRLVPAGFVAAVFSRAERMRARSSEAGSCTWLLAEKEAPQEGWRRRFFNDSIPHAIA